MLSAIIFKAQDCKLKENERHILCYILLTYMCLSFD